MAELPELSSGVDQTSTLLGVTWTFTAVGTVFVLGRLYCRCNFGILGWDDFWMTLTSMLSWSMSITWTVYANLGGTRYDALTPSQAATVQHLNWISQTLCIAALACGKLAIVALILRLQAPSKTRTRLLVTLVSIACCYATVVIILIFKQCTPSATLWDPAGNPDGVCLDPWVLVGTALGLGSYYAALDLILAAIPVHMIWKLQMPLKKKILVCCLLSTGVVACAMGIVKTIMLPSDISRGTDLVRLATLLFIWNAIEVNVVIIAGCIPTLIPLFELYKGRDPRTTNFTQNGPPGQGSRSDKQFSRRGFKPMGFSKKNTSETWSHLKDGQHSSGTDGTEQEWIDATTGRPKSDIPLRDGITVTKTVDITEEPA